MHWLGLILMLSTLSDRPVYTTLLQDDFTGRAPGTSLGGTSVQGGILSREYTGTDNWSFRYGDGFIYTDDVVSGIANRSVSVPFTLADMPAGTDVLRLEVTADPTLYRADPSFPLQFGFGGIDEETVYVTCLYNSAGASKFYFTYTDRADVPHSLAGTTTASAIGGSVDFAIEYNTTSDAVSLSVNGSSVVSNLSLIGEFGSAPTIASLSFKAIRAGTDTNGHELYHSFRLAAWNSANRDYTPQWQACTNATTEAVGDQWMQVSYEDKAGETMDLPLLKPTALPDDLTRIKFWYANILGDTTPSFLVQDAAGTIHNVPLGRANLMDPPTIDWDASRVAEWPLWITAESISLDMPTEEMIEQRFLPADATAAIRKLWPKPLTLLGVRLTAAETASWGALAADKAAIAAGNGVITLGNPVVSVRNSFDADSYGMILENLRQARDEPMLLFLDDMASPDGLVRMTGDVHYCIRVRHGYQGPVVWKTEGDGFVDSTNRPLQLMDQAIELPELPAGRYFIETDAWLNDALTPRTRMLQWFIAEGPEEEPASLHEPFVLDTGRENQVFDSSTTEAELSVHNDSPNATGAIRLSIINWTGTEVYSQQLSCVEEQMVTLPVQSGYDYFATASLLDASDRVTDVALLHFGVSNAPVSVGTAPDMPNLDDVCKGQMLPHVEYWHRAHAEYEYPWTLGMNLDDVQRWADQANGYGWKHLAIRTFWPDLELLPGVTRWELIDAMADMARANGQQTMMGASTVGNRGAPVWMDWMPGRDQTGDFHAGLFPVSQFDPVETEARLHFWKEMTEHYLQDTNMIGYHMMGVAMSADAAPEERQYDYSLPAQEAYAEWLQEKGLPDEPLTPLLTIPRAPIYTLGADFSQGWQNFAAFQHDTYIKGDKSVMEAIRSVDTERPIIMDRKPYVWGGIEGMVPWLAADGNAALKNEGSPQFSDVISRTMSMQGGVPYLGELHRHIPTSCSLADVVTFWESLWADHGLWLLRWRGSDMDSWIKQEGTLRGDVPQVLDFVAATQDHWDTFIQAPFDVPQTLVFGSRASVLLGSRRRGYFNELDGNSTFSALFRVHQVPVYMADEYTDWVDLSRFKVVFACGEIMTGHAIDRLVDFVESGGRLVLVGNAGYYNTDDPSSTNVLAGRLAGAMTNVRSIPEPERMVIDSQYDASDAPYEFDAGELETLLSWAGVERPAEVVSQAVAGFPGFEVSTRRNAAGDQVYVGAMRSWFGGYGDHIETQAQVDAQCAKAAGSVVLHGLADGTWQISKFHRDERSLGTASAVGGKLSFATDPAEAAEVQLFVLTRE